MITLRVGRALQMIWWGMGFLVVRRMETRVRMGLTMRDGWGREVPRRKNKRVWGGKSGRWVRVDSWEKRRARRTMRMKRFRIWRMRMMIQKRLFEINVRELLRMCLPLPSNTTSHWHWQRPLRTYTLYITYTPYYRTPRMYLSGYESTSSPLPPHLMMEDIVGDYKDKTVTLEDFPFFDNSVKMASIHPCKHASVMKILLDRADSALKLRLERQKSGQGSVTKNMSGMEGLIDDTSALRISEAKRGHEAGVKAATGGAAGDEWEVLDESARDEDEEKVAIRVDQYLVVFLKFMASVTPGIEHDFTMGLWGYERETRHGEHD
jgi:hypothetical protein